MALQRVTLTGSWCSLAHGGRGGPVSPPDLAAKQAELDAWLKEVGWLSGAAATEP